MGVGLEHVYLDYILKCYPGAGLSKKKADRLALVAACSQYRFASLQELPNCKTVVGLGTLSGEVLTGYGKIGEIEGTHWPYIESQMLAIGIESVWVGYNPCYVMEKPGEAGGVYRVIWMAACEAGLNPIFHPEVKPFQFPE